MFQKQAGAGHLTVNSGLAPREPIVVTSLFAILLSSCPLLYVECMAVLRIPPPLSDIRSTSPSRRAPERLSGPKFGSGMARIVPWGSRVRYNIPSRCTRSWKQNRTTRCSRHSSKKATGPTGWRNDRTEMYHHCYATAAEQVRKAQRRVQDSPAMSFLSFFACRAHLKLRRPAGTWLVPAMCQPCIGTFNSKACSLPLKVTLPR